MKDKALDEYSSKVATLDREAKRLQKELEFLQAQGLKVRELERENKDLQQANIVEHQTLTAIRLVILNALMFIIISCNYGMRNPNIFIC